jgi:hypothetical protein
VYVCVCVRVRACVSIRRLTNATMRRHVCVTFQPSAIMASLKTFDKERQAVLGRIFGMVHKERRPSFGERQVRILNICSVSMSAPLFPSPGLPAVKLCTHLFLVLTFTPRAFRGKSGGIRVPNFLGRGQGRPGHIWKAK